MKVWVPIATFGVVTAAVVAFAQSPRRPVSYASEIKPFLEKNCAPCHYGSQRQGGLSLASIAQILKGGGKGAAVIPGKASESRMVLLMEHKAEPKMPPIPGAAPLDKK